MDDRPVRSFFRIAKKVPPADKEYLTNQDRRGPPRDELPQRVKDSWDGLSAFESEETARAAARNSERDLGKFIVRYDIPAGSGISATYTPEIAEGHYDLRGDKEELKRYLTDFVAGV